MCGETMHYEALLQNIMDQVKEAQIKLGYAKETIRLYYPVSTLNAILETNVKSDEAMLELLKEQSMKNNILGDLKFAAHQHRVEICVPPKGAEYVYQNVPNPLFLMDLIELFRKNHHCSFSEIESLFLAYSEEYVCEKMPEGSDFDAVLYFKDKAIDAYYYCIKEEMGHTIYHRFTKEDMAELFKE